nr:TonB-dependent receptor [uncultured Dyadobacter sp.]
MKFLFDYFPLLIRVMKITFAQLLLVLIFTNLGLAASDGHAQDVLSRPVSLNVKGQELGTVLDQLSKEAKIKFTYVPKLIDQGQRVTFVATREKLSAVLDRLLKPLHIKYEIDGEFVVLRKEQNQGLRSRGFQDIRESMAAAQVAKADITITGAVTDDKGEGLPGVSIILKGTQRGTSTDVDGGFTLNVPDNTGTLVFSYVGYVSQEISIGNQSKIDVKLASESKALEEIVVVGYGVQEKKTLTGAVSAIDEKELRAVPTGDASARLQGRVAGVTVTNSSEPGGPSTVRVRGVGSINNNDPLYVVDGVPTNTGLQGINPNDVESMTVLKDASAAAIYGSRAANGVIVVTTKRGKQGKIKMNLDVRYGAQRASNKLDMLNSQELGELLWQRKRNAGLTPGGTGWADAQYGNGENPVVPDYVLPGGAMEGEVDESTYAYPNPYNGITRANKQGTDWFDEVFSAAPIQEYNLAIMGGGEKSNFAISGGYLNQKGIVSYTGFKRYALRANSDFTVSKWLKVGQTIGATMADRLGFMGTASGNQPVAFAIRQHPLIPVYDIRGNFAGTKAPGTGNGHNPVAMLYRAKDNVSRQMRIMGSVYAQIDFTKDLWFKSLIGIDYNSTRGKARTLADPEWTQSTNNNVLTENQRNIFQYNWTNTLNFRKTFLEKHNLNVLAGVEAISNRDEIFVASRSTFPFTDLDYMVLDAGQKDIANSGTFDQWALFSYFLRANYDFKGKYLLEATVRRDASSRFAPENRWGTFPAFSAGWRIVEEPFLRDVRWLSDLKIRAGWGQNGNDNVGNYNAYTTYRAAGLESYYNISGTSSTRSDAGLHLYSLGNREGQWETSITTNLGIDAVFFNNKLEANIDVYKRRTTNMLYPDSRPDTWGGVVLPSINIGEMENKGIDLILNYRNRIGKDLNFNIGANLSHYRNRVVRLNDNPKEIRFGNTLLNEVYTATTAGQPISSFYGYVVEGIFNTQEEVSNHPKYNPDINGRDTYSMPGVFKYKDVNGDGKITTDDRTFIGSPHPSLTYGLNIGMDYKGWDLTMFFQGVVGSQLVNFTNREILFTRHESNYLRRRLYESWTQERYDNGEKITLPITLANDGNMQKPSTFFVESGRYLRMKDFQVGYTLPKTLTEKLKMDRLRIYFQSTNLFTLTKYTGLDPEVTEPNDGHKGVDAGVYPIPQIFMLGVNLNF